MKRIFFILFFFTQIFAQGQKVGLVLSGGAAKGLAHVGVLKALEENDVPIDYIVGTSMGGIIAGCYAAGLSPEQIEHMMLSKEFLRWIRGEPEKGYNYYYHQSNENPHFVKLNLSLDSTLNIQFNTSLASDVSLNFALAEKMAQASAISNNNFDSLFIPLRVVAADIFTQNQVILSSGHLSDALRATQTVPLFYNPIRVDGKYLFDGGIYNNFPVDIAQQDFHPEVIIGSNVSTKIYDEYPYDNDEKLINSSLLMMLLDKSDPTKIPENGVYVQPNLTGYSSFDFSRARSMIDSGYIQTIRQMPEIKKKIHERRTCETVMAKRNHFNDKNFPMEFDALTFKGFNARQRRYITRIFHINPDKPRPLYFNEIKHDYFRLVSENYFTNAYPNILFNSDRKKFQFQLSRRPQKNFQADFGGVIATRDISNIFLGLNFFKFDRTLTHLYAGFQTGNFYKSAVLSARKDFPFQFYIEPELIFNSWNYLGGNDLLQEISPTVLKRLDRRFSLHVGVPLAQSLKGVISVEALNNVDRYDNNDIFISTDTLDQLQLRGYKLGFSISTNNLNRKQYASEGHSYSLTANYFNVNEYYTPGNTSVQNQYSVTEHQWLRVKVGAEQYFNAGWFRPGYFAEAVLSNQPFFKNYFGTIVNAPAFLPLQDSRTLILQNFRAFNYFAGGVRNVFAIRKRLDFRLEGYLFKPIEYLQKGTNQEAVSNTDIKKIFFAGTAGFVLHSPLGPVSLSLNYYDDNENQLGILFHVGFLLYNKHSIDQ